MKTNNREILIYYHPNSQSGRQTLAHAKCMSKHVKAFAFDQSPSTGTSWQMIIRSLDIHPKKLLNKAHPYYQTHIRGHEFDDENWLKIIAHNPDMIKSPIAVRGRKAVVCAKPTDIYKLIAPRAPLG